MNVLRSICRKTNVAPEVFLLVSHSHNKVFLAPPASSTTRLCNKKKWIFLISFAPVCCVLMLQWRSYTKSHYCSTGCRKYHQIHGEAPDDIIAITDTIAGCDIFGKITFESNFLVLPLFNCMTVQKCLYLEA